jgi:hypothetical protein
MEANRGSGVILGVKDSKILFREEVRSIIQENGPRQQINCSKNYLLTAMPISMNVQPLA